MISLIFWVGICDGKAWFAPGFFVGIGKGYISALVASNGAAFGLTAASFFTKCAMKNTNKLLFFSLLFALGMGGCGQSGGSDQKSEAAVAESTGAERQDAATNDKEAADESGENSGSNPSPVRFTPPGVPPTPVNRLLVV